VPIKAAQLRGALLPIRLGPPELRQDGEDWFVGYTLDTALHALLAQVRRELRHHARFAAEPPAVPGDRALDIVREFGADLPRIRELLDSDVFAAYRGDPAPASGSENASRAEWSSSACAARCPSIDPRARINASIDSNIIANDIADSRSAAWIRSLGIPPVVIECPSCVNNAVGQPVYASRGI
jgi:hypothetical protein